MQKQQRFHLICAVHGVLQKPTGEVFILRRFNTGWRDGEYSLPAGHLDGEETVTKGVIREVREESGVTVDPENIAMVHVMHRVSELNESIDFFFVIKKWQGEPHLAEPDKSDQVMWVSPQNLPANTVDYISFFFGEYAAGRIYSEFGWK